MPRDDFLEWPFFETRHRELADELRRWLAANESGPVDDEDDRACCRRLVGALGEAGLLAHAVTSVEARSLCLARETLSHEHGLADFAFAMQGLGSAPIRLSGDDSLKERYLRETAAGRQIAAFALSEPDAGSDVGAIACRAVADGGHYVLDGTKTWISNGGIADYYVVFARTGDEPGGRGLSAFVVEADDPGLDASEAIEVTAPHPLATLVFDGCRIPASRRIGAEGEGFPVAMATLDVFRATVGAAALGFARRALDETLVRVESRRQFGKKLADFQLTQARIADMATSIDAAALLVYRAAWTQDRLDRRTTRESSMAKLYATEAAQRVVDDAVQLHGATGVVRGGVVERLYRDVRALRIYEGTTEIQKLIIARELRPREPKA